MPAYSRVTVSPFSPNPKYHESPYLINEIPHFAAADERELLPSTPFPIFPIRVKSLLSCATECTPNALEHLALLPLRVSERRFSFASHSGTPFQHLPWLYRQKGCRPCCVQTPSVPRTNGICALYRCRLIHRNLTTLKDCNPERLTSIGHENLYRFGVTGVYQCVSESFILRPKSCVVVG